MAATENALRTIGFEARTGLREGLANLISWHESKQVTKQVAK
jgi:hypothetical protein